MYEAMMNKLKIGVASVLALTLASCAPAAMGTLVTVPVVAVTSSAPAALGAGQTVYAQYTYDGGALDISDARFDNFDLNFGDRASNNDVRSQERPAPWLSARALNLPDGWSVTVAEAYLVKAISKTTNSDTSTRIKYADRVRVIYRITAPQTASGTQTVRLQFTDSGKDIGEIPLRVTVTSGQVGLLP